jgi:hypothetical protein
MSAQYSYADITAGLGDNAKKYVVGAHSAIYDSSAQTMSLFLLL